MSSLNRVFLAGNLTRDPELRKTSSGVAVADLGVAINENYTNREGTRVEGTCFVDVVVWDRQAETCRKYLSKGAPVLVEGKLQLDQWQTETGERRNRLRVRAMRVQFLGRRPEAANEQAGEAGPDTERDPVESDEMPF